jgi:uncharacterized protein (UPF0262 family)
MKIADMADMPDAAASDASTRAPSLKAVMLEGETRVLSKLQQADRDQAVRDLAVANLFVPRNFAGPFVLRLSIDQGRLIFDIRDEADRKLIAIGLALGPFRRLLKDYQMLVESYAHAVQDGREASIQAIDMGRRGLHNEGAELMMARLAHKVDLDFETARRLFTLVCVLHQRI